MSVTELAPGLRAPQHQEGQHKGKWIRKVSHCSLFNSLLAKYPKHTHQGFPKRCCEKLNYTILLWKWHAFEKEINNGESLKECTPSMQKRGSPGKTTGIPKWTMWGCSMLVPFILNGIFLIVIRRRDPNDSINTQFKFQCVEAIFILLYEHVTGR